MKLIKTKKALLNELHNFIQGTSNQPTLTDLWNDAIEYDVSDLETLKNELEGLDINLSSVDANLSAWKDGTYYAMYDPLHMYEYIFGELRYNRKGNTIPIRGEYWTKDDRYDIWYKHFPEWDDVIHAKKIKDKMMDLTFYLDTADKERIEEIAY